nr:nucleotidyltransferase domain-containing protein [Candidatus Sigynarchaeota archaeon]
MDVKQIEGEITFVLRKHDEIRFAYLFGSSTRQAFFEDIDVGVMLADDFTYGTTYPETLGLEIEQKLYQNLHFIKPIDVRILNGVKSTMFLNSALRTARLLFTRDDAERVGFDVRVTRASSKKIFVFWRNTRMSMMSVFLQVTRIFKP